MPRYDYRCTSCAHDFEVSRPIGESSDETCPRCDSAARRLFTPVGVVFRGSGFHNTDYRKTSSGSDSTSESVPSKTSDTPCGSNCSSCPAAES